ncbi:TRAP transporter permease [Azospirillum sp. ST 5-10]|uniref:TRAP transporter permease n=1 Tax=unclassified Azospirillum TaxID=2630922 RepID=UPI003F4A0A64
MSVVNVLFGTGKIRRPEGWLGTAVKLYSAAISVGVVYNTIFTITDMMGFLIVFLSAMLVLVFLTVAPTMEDRSGRPWLLDWGLAALAAASGVYFWLHLDTIVQRIALFDPLTPYDMFFGSAVLLMTLEATRRATGLGLLLIVVGFLAYNLFGHHFGGELGHGYIPPEHLIDVTVFTTDGIFGVPLRVAATYAFLFVLFGTALARAGGGDFFYRIGALLTGRTTGGTAKIAIVSSGAYGMVSGSPTSDVVTTGSVTIPAMERAGYSPRQAGAIEVAACTGGSLMPPVMGSVAFIMAEYTTIPYYEIAVAAIVPAVLYYLGVFVQVHYMSKRLGMRGLDRSEIPSLRESLRGGDLFLVPLTAIVIGLALGYSASLVAFIGTLAVLAVSMFHKESRLGPVAIFDVLTETTLKTVGVVAACAAAGLVIGGLSMTGLAAKFSALITVVGGGTMIGSLMVAAAVTILLGMGMPTPSVYILATILVGPAIQGFGLSVMAANMFLLYFAVLSATTPPVAVAAYAAAAIARANPVMIAATATRLSIAAILVPFAFAYSPELLLIGSPVAIVVAIVTAVVGVVFVGIAVEGYLDRPLPAWSRLLTGVGGVCLVIPSMWLALLGLALGIAGLSVGYDRSGKRARTATPRSAAHEATDEPMSLHREAVAGK